MAGAASHVRPGVAYYTREDGARCRALVDRLGSIRVARRALSCNESAFDAALGYGRVLVPTREKMLAKLAELEATT